MITLTIKGDWRLLLLAWGSTAAAVVLACGCHQAEQRTPAAQVPIDDSSVGVHEPQACPLYGEAVPHTGARCVVVEDEIDEHGEVFIRSVDEFDVADIRLLHERWYPDGSGDLQLFSRQTYIYDADNRLLSSVYDIGMDGAPEGCTTFFYYGNTVTSEYDCGVDGWCLRRATYTYDDSGNLLRAAHDSDADGGICWFEDYTYDEAGRIVIEFLDVITYNPYGVYAEYYLQHTYDEEGRVVRTDFGTSPGESAYAHHLFTYDAMDSVLLVHETIRADGTLSSRIDYLYSEGLIQLESHDVDYDGVSDWWLEYLYDELGNLTAKYEVDASTGAVDQRYDYAYDSDGNLIFLSYDGDADGVPSTSSLYSYDTDGHLVLFERLDEDGYTTLRISYTGCSI